MTFLETLNSFYHPDDQDMFARTMGWQDAAQMAYYEDMANAQAAVESEQLPPPPAEIVIDPSHTVFIDSLKRCEAHELAKVDSREVYTDDDQCPPDDLRDWQDLAGVY